MYTLISKEKDKKKIPNKPINVKSECLTFLKASSKDLQFSGDFFLKKKNCAIITVIF
jgi:hypothetical protein